MAGRLASWNGLSLPKCGEIVTEKNRKLLAYLWEFAILNLFWGEQQATVAIVAVACNFSGIPRFLQPRHGCLLER